MSAPPAAPPRTTTLPRKQKPPTETCRISADLARMLRIVCAVDDVGAPEYLEQKLRPILQRDYDRAVKKLNATKEDREDN